MDNNDLLERAIQIAAAAHAGQRDKSGAPYILHPLRIMGRAKSVEVQIVGVLHDVVEDTDWTPERLAAEGFPPLLLDAIALVTKQPSEEDDYEAFIRRIKDASGEAGRIARAVKRLDLEDNMNLLRLREFTDKDAERMKHYLVAYRLLGFDEDTA